MANDTPGGVRCGLGAKWAPQDVDFRPGPLVFHFTITDAFRDQRIDAQTLLQIGFVL